MNQHYILIGMYLILCIEIILLSVIVKNWKYVLPIFHLHFKRLWIVKTKADKYHTTASWLLQYAGKFTDEKEFGYLLKNVEKFKRDHADNPLLNSDVKSIIYTACRQAHNLPEPYNEQTITEDEITAVSKGY